VRSAVRLCDLGERRLIEEILGPRYGQQEAYGDDCALIPSERVEPGATLVVTTDPCPPAMAHAVGFDDLFYSGWLVATINLSDLAAAGADPLGLLTSFNLPRDTTVADFERLLDGVDACCGESETSVLGGNLKETPARDFAATAIGQCVGTPLSRRGAEAGDAIVVVGELGAFWAGVLSLREGLIEREPSHTLLRNVLTPRPQLAAMSMLRGRGLAKAAMDTSDGLYPTLLELGRINGLRVDVKEATLCVAEDVATAAEALGLEPLRLALGFGDWQVVIAASPDHVDAILETAAAAGSTACRIGSLATGAGVYAEASVGAGRLLALDSERFSNASWFSAGLEGYIETLREAPLIGDG
jgi:thiamine-monophosphate kinase